METAQNAIKLMNTKLADIKEFLEYFRKEVKSEKPRERKLTIIYDGSSKNELLASMLSETTYRFLKVDSETTMEEFVKQLPRTEGLLLLSMPDADYSVLNRKDLYDDVYAFDWGEEDEVVEKEDSLYVKLSYRSFPHKFGFKNASYFELYQYILAAEGKRLSEDSKFSQEDGKVLLKLFSTYLLDKSHFDDINFLDNLENAVKYGRLFFDYETARLERWLKPVKVVGDFGLFVAPSGLTLDEIEYIKENYPQLERIGVINDRDIVVKNY